MATNVAELRLGDLFVRDGLIDAKQLQDALADSKESGTRIGFSLVKLGFVGENELTRMLSKQYRLPAVDLEKVEGSEGSAVRRRVGPHARRRDGEAPEGLHRTLRQHGGGG